MPPQSVHKHFELTRTVSGKHFGMLIFENIEVYIDIFKEVSTRVYRGISTGDFKSRKVSDVELEVCSGRL